MRFARPWVGFCALAFLAGGCSYPRDSAIVVRQIDGTFGAATLQESETGSPVAGHSRSGFSTPGVVQLDYDLDGATDDELAYDLGSDGTLRVKGVAVADVSVDGQLMIGGNLDPESPSAGLTISAAAKAIRGTGDFTFSGQYVLCALGGNAATGAYWTRRQLGTTDGTGTLTTGIIAHSEGTTGSATLAYSIHDGNIGMDPYLGTVTVDGRVAVLSLPSDPTGELCVAVRRNQGVAQPSLHGDFAGYEFRHELGVSRTSRITLHADGVGAGSLVAVYSDGGAVEEAFTYALHPDGTVDFNDGSSGIVSEDGRFLAVVDTDRSDGGIGFLLALRRN